jgi:hypothetical protein
MTQPPAKALSTLRREFEADGGPGALGKLLVAAGALLRHAEDSRSEVSAALGGLGDGALESWAETVDLVALKTVLTRAADEAVEAAIPEATGEGETWAEWAWQSLGARDRLESCLAALDCAGGLGSAAAVKLSERFKAALLPIDRQLRPRARWLSAVNGRRRAERDQLLPSHRERAWWFTSRADCDELVRLLAGELTDSPHLASCADCRRDLEVARVVNDPHARHLSDEDLWRLDAGTASKAERAAAQVHARNCPDCARALRAMEEGEQTIRDLTEGEPSSPAARTRRERAPAFPLTAARSRGNPEMRVVDDQPAFRVVLAERRNRMVLFIEPHRDAQVSSAIAYVGGKKRGITALATPKGLEIDLGATAELAGGKARLVVELVESRYEREVEL